MSQAVIEIDGIGKRYRLGVCHAMHKGLGDRLRSAVRRTGRRLVGKQAAYQREDVWALRDVAFDVKRGEVVGLIGRNGAGKSTLLKILSRITEPTCGEAVVRGRMGSLLEVGTGFHPELTGRENIYLNGAVLGMNRREIRDRFDAIVAFSGVSDFLDTPVKRYSSGMTVRLAFAVAAHLDPEVLTIDEVLAVGDAAFQRRCLGKMRELAGQEGRTILFVSHNMDAVATLCDRVVHMRGGRMIDIGKPQPVIARYLAHQGQGTTAEYRAAPDATTELQGDVPGARLVQAGLIDAHGGPTQTLRFGEPFAVRMNWRLRANQPDVSFTVRLFDQSGRLLFAADNTADPHKPAPDVAGGVQVACHFPYNVLVPGEYRVEVSAWLHPGIRLEQIDECLRFVVHDVPFQTDRRFAAVASTLVSVDSQWRYRSAA